MPPRLFADCTTRSRRVMWTMRMMRALGVLEDENCLLLMGPKNEFAMSANLNATIALLAYIDLTWVKQIRGATQIQFPHVLEQVTYVYVILFLDHGVVYAGELGADSTWHGSSSSSHHGVL